MYIIIQYFCLLQYCIFVECYIFLNLDSLYTLAKLVGTMFRIIHMDNISQHARINKNILKSVWQLLLII